MAHIIEDGSIFRSWEEIPMELEVEETANDSDKTISIPAGEEWQIISIWIEYSTTATVGNRELELQIRDSAGDIVGGVVIFTMTASKVYIAWLFQGAAATPNNASGTSARILANGASGNPNESTIFPLPTGFALPSGFDMRFIDVAAVDAAADDMIIQMLVKKRK